MLYAARKRLRNAASGLPELPDSMFGWIPVLYRITDEEVLSSAGLDAYVVSQARAVIGGPCIYLMLTRGYFSVSVVLHLCH